MPWRYLARNKRALLIAAALVAALTLLTASWRGGREPGYIDRGIMFVTAPLLKGFASVADLGSQTVEYLFGSSGLREENRRLRDEVTRLRQEAEKRFEEELACRRLSEIFEFRRETGHRMTVASVIGHDSTNLFRTILLNKGERDGLEKNLAVITPEGVVGKIIDVFPRSARVLLITDRSSGIDAIVQRTRDQGVVLGLGARRCEVKYLSRRAAVTVGDRIVTSGMAGIFPKGMRIGEVADVRRGGHLLQKVEVTPAVSLDRLEEVIVLVREEGKEGQ
jgi:rod shape-determining protein MreC